MPQRGGLLFVQMEVPHKIDAGIPDNVRVVDFCEDIEQVLDVYIFRPDPPCFSEVGFVRININRHPGEVTFLGCAEEWG